MLVTKLILHADSLERFRNECMKQEDNLLQGKCQLCLDGLMLVVPDEDPRSDVRNPLKSCQDEYLLNLIRNCPNIKIVHPPNKPLKGFIDLSLFESCNTLELIRVPFNQITGTECVRQNVRTLVWRHGNDELINESSLYLSCQSQRGLNESMKSLRIDELFWDQFGSWPVLEHLCITGSNIALINASTIPTTVKSLHLPYNRICHFNNLVNYSTESSITKLCLEYNSLEEFPKLNPNTFSSLTHLSLRANLLATVTGLRNFSSLEYLDLSENCICDMQQVLLELSYLSSTLKTLILKNNPISAKKSLRSNCESVLQNLTSFDGKNVKRKTNLEPLTLVGPEYRRISTDGDGGTSGLTINPSKERFVVIGDESDPDSPAKLIRKPKRIEAKNYFFGGYSGSYESNSYNFLPALGSQSNTIAESPPMVTAEISEVIGPEKSEIEIPDVMGETEKKEEEVVASTPEDMGIVIKIESQDPVESVSEWATEDTEENTVFLAEIHSNQADLEKALTADDPDYFFIRIRPHDGLIYEKDCTSGKVLQTLDLKILERYECMDEHLAVKMFFDTCIVSKKERIYRFLDEKSFRYFVDMFLSKCVEYRSLYQTAAVDIAASQSNLSSTNNSGSKFSAPWFYMCLRCGDRTHRIITDCPKCGSDLIIRDESFQSTGNSLCQSQSNFQQPVATNFDQAEESIDTDPVTLDENYFRSNINHYLKLHVEIYLYDKIGDESLKSETVEILFHCLLFDFANQSFKPGLAVLTANYFFLFHHFKDKTFQLRDEDLSSSKKSSFYGSSKEDNRKDLVSLVFYCPLATPEPMILSHLPKQIKNIGYWFESKSGRKIKNKRKNQYFLELVMFADAIMGKAFLELLFKFQKACQATNLIVVKNSITKLIDGDHEEASDRLRLVLDETCREMLEQRKSPVPTNDQVIPTILNANIFPLDSFRFIQNVNLSMNENLFTMNENIALIVFNDYLVIGELYCSFKQISMALKSFHHHSMAELLKDYRKFDDRIELKTLFKEWIINLLPNIFIDKNEFFLILRFRDDDNVVVDHSKSNPKIQKPVSTGEQKSQSDLVIYEFKLQFLSLHSLIQTCRMIRSCWENNFGVSLTFSKYSND